MTNPLLALVQAAQSQIGVAYAWGDEAPGSGFDCSGLVQWAAGKAGISLPRTAQAQYDATARISAVGAPPAGALVFFGNDANDIEHVGISLGSWFMVDAPHTGARVRIESFTPGSGWNLVGITDPTGGSAGIDAPTGVASIGYTSPTTDTASFLSGATHSLTNLTVTGLLLAAGVAVIAAGIWRTTQQGKKAT